ncbi:glycosyltransferase family 4 protein [Jannaschia sp. Os4]|uniref:glycosyltransferase family 4 protein n=1 Tax=Jannaschia sp. Os4 TaxID=2807617 RepID=UPI0031B636A3
MIAPNFKRRLSGVTSTIARLVPLQARDIAIAATGPGLPPDIPHVPLSRVLTMSRRGPSGPRVWHARRNVEMIGGLALRALGKDLRLLFTSASQRHHSGLTKALIRRMDAVVATSAKTAGYLDREATVILHGIDAAAFAPPPDRSALRARLGLPDGTLVGCYGRIRESKGTDLFVDAMVPLLRDRPEASAVVMGRAVEKHAAWERDLRARVPADVAARVLFKPEVPVTEMAAWYGALDLYVAPQRWEGFGLTPLEAMACGVPVVATDVGAFSELLSPESGVIVPPGEAGALGGAIAPLLDDADRRGAMGAAARARVEARFRLEDEAAALIAVYRSLIGS